MGSAKFAKLALVLLVLPGLSSAQTYTVLHSFSGAPDGANPEASLILDSAANLYGTTSFGGAANAGAIFKLDPSGNESLLYSFTGGTDGGNPAAALIEDSAGNLYGTTLSGGATGEGTVFKFMPTGAAFPLHVFAVKKDGHSPAASLLRDSAGSLYGTTVLGGSANDGVVFRVDSSGHETILYKFRGTDGANPFSGLLLDPAGNLYGTTCRGKGTSGNVFALTPSGTQSVLHKFTGKNDGGSPRAGLIIDSAGILYGTTVYGGTHRAGTVFKVNPLSAQEKVLYSFSGGADGGDPYGGLVRDSLGNLYGTTYYGGAFGYGTIFKLDPAGNETVLYSFAGGSDGLGPMAGLVRDAAGNLYGTTIYGGANGFGVVFKLVP